MGMIVIILTRFRLVIIQLTEPFLSEKKSYKEEHFKNTHFLR